MRETSERAYNRECRGKKAYPTYRWAANDCKSLRRHHNEIVMPYRCRYCSSFHIGHMLPQGKRRRRPKVEEEDEE